MSDGQFWALLWTLVLVGIVAVGYVLYLLGDQLLLWIG